MHKRHLTISTHDANTAVCADFVFTRGRLVSPRFVSMMSVLYFCPEVAAVVGCLTAQIHIGSPFDHAAVCAEIMASAFEAGVEKEFLAESESL